MRTGRGFRVLGSVARPCGRISARNDFGDPRSAPGLFHMVPGVSGDDVDVDAHDGTGLDAHAGGFPRLPSPARTQGVGRPALPRSAPFL